jgi:hypothetical protein
VSWRSFIGIIDVFRRDAGDFRLERQQTGSLIIGIEKFEHAVRCSKHESFELVTLNVGNQAPYAAIITGASDVANHGLLQPLATGTGVGITRLMGTIRKVSRQAIQITQGTDPQIPATVTPQDLTQIAPPIGMGISATHTAATQASIGSFGFPNH